MRNRLIQLVHVAKRQLALDDVAYRALLEGAVGKRSCNAMTINELEQVLAACEQAGFKRVKKRIKYSPKSGYARTSEADKIRALWITMGKQGFLRDASDTALNKWCARATVRLNDGEGVANVGWLTPHLAYKVLEALKNWHRRLMAQAIIDNGGQPPLNEKGQLASYTRVECVFRNNQARDML